MNRAIIYLLFHPQNLLPEYVLHKLSKLRKHASYIHVVVNGDLNKTDSQKIKAIVDHLQFRENIGMDVGAYQDAINKIGFENLNQFDELILMNYTWYGPMGDFSQLFKQSESLEVDFWGITEHAEVKPNPYTKRGNLPQHIQSHWIAVRNSILNSKEWNEYWTKMPVITSYSESILKHESRFTKYFGNHGFKYEVLFPLEKYGVDHPAFIAAEQLIQDGCEVLKRRPFFHDPLYLDSEAIVGRHIISAAKSKGYPVELIWADQLKTTPAKILHTNTSQLKVLENRAQTTKPYLGKIAVVVHIFYLDLVDELVSKIKLIPGQVSLIITTETLEKATKIGSHLAQLGWPSNNLDIRVVESNRGRDLSAYFIACRDVVSSRKFDLIVKIHSKKTVQAGAVAGEFFKNQQIENLLHTKGYVRNLFRMFEDDPQLGIVFPPMIHMGYPTLGNAWFSNRKPAISYAKSLKLQVPIDEGSPLAAFGAMWVCRPESLALMTSREYRYEEYQPESKHGDGSLAHVQERFVAYAAAHSGFKTATVANTDYISISHAMLEFKLDKIMSVAPGTALHSLPVLQHFANQARILGSRQRLESLKILLSTQFPLFAKSIKPIYIFLRGLLGSNPRVTKPDEKLKKY